MEWLKQLWGEVRRHLIAFSLPRAVVTFLLASLVTRDWRPQVFGLWMGAAIIMIAIHNRTEREHQGDILNSPITLMVGVLVSTFGFSCLPAWPSTSTFVWGMSFTVTVMVSEVFYHSYRHGLRRMADPKQAKPLLTLSDVAGVFAAVSIFFLPL